ncbi:MAG: thermonuclease family protein [Candidatus Rokuibacteriota bacterium]
MTLYGAPTRRAGRAFLLVLAILAVTTAARGEVGGYRAAAKVVRVSDGDTLVARLATVRPGLKSEEKVRLVGINCPESA